MTRSDDPSMLAFRRVSQQNACMPTSITIRDVPTETRDELAARAARSGRSLQEYLRARLIELAAHPDPADVLARARQRLRRTGTSIPPEVLVGYVREDRDR
jgi:antitoxin FitA